MKVKTVLSDTTLPGLSPYIVNELHNKIWDDKDHFFTNVVTQCGLMYKDIKFTAKTWYGEILTPPTYSNASTNITCVLTIILEYDKI